MRGASDELAKHYRVRGTPYIVFVNAKGKTLCRAGGGFNNRADALDLDRFVQRIATDKAFRQAQGSKGCGRISASGDTGTAQAPPVTGER